jgi:hypothetical protein
VQAVVRVRGGALVPPSPPNGARGSAPPEAVLPLADRPSRSGRRRWLSIAAIASSNSAGLPQFSVGSRWAHHTTPPTARGTDQIRQPGCRRPACRARRRTGRTELAKPEQSDHVSVPRAHELPSERVTADLRARITTREWQPGEASADCERARGQVQRQPGDRGEGGPRSGGRGLAGYAGAVGDVRSACTLGGLA